CARAPSSMERRTFYYW
nr:immunoglobulin heavy chain junction region [Macaca mulatta]MOV45476.1 immunoglobulin heavy chain junction region [Macaca mulatta]MOV46062.1 immunoglobulin heavy chain junction region [Macaca mulatta]